jgi:mannose-6-phosphate isomerase class I
MNDRILKLTGHVQHYAWGGYDFIPELMEKHFDKGKAFFILAETDYKLVAKEDTVIYKAFVPLN